MMHKFFIWFLFVYCFVNDLHSWKMPDLNYPETIEGQMILLTSPRSGTNLTVCSLQILTRRPLINFLLEKIQNPHPVYYNRINLELDETKPCFFSTHKTKYIKMISSKKNKLMLLIRNPIEMVMRVH